VGRRSPTISEHATIAALQHESRAGAIDENLERIGQAIRAAAEHGVDLAVLPETGLQGYGYEDADAVRRDATSLSDPAFARARDLVATAGIHAIVGFIERDGDRLFNSAALIDPGGDVLALHRKVHMPCLGVDRFVERGDREPVVADTPVGRIGMLICADMIFPEAARVAALNGADAIAISACVPQSISIYSDALVRVRAYENCAYVVFADMAGPDGEWSYEGRSQIADPSGRVVAEAPVEGAAMLTATLDIDETRAKVRVRRPRGGIPHPYEVDFFGQRRPELYGRITDPVAPAAHAMATSSQSPSPGELT
jgi:5-aminopentanamidase